MLSTATKNDTGLFPLVLADIKRTVAPAQGLDVAGNTQSINAAAWIGPYILQRIGKDPVSGASYTYRTNTPNVGKVMSSAAGRALDGTFYNSW